MAKLKTKSARRAFTIIEMMVVVAAIAFLVSVAVPAFNAMSNQAKQVKAEGDLNVIKLALNTYNMRNYCFPEDNAEQGQAILLSESVAVLDSYRYDPFGATLTTRYEYKLSSNGYYYVVYSVGRNRDGVMTISDSGSCAITAGNPIYVTNGILL